MAEHELRSRYEHEGASTERYASPSFWDARYHQRRFAAICEMLEGPLSSATSFLDVGAGTGEYLQFARARGVAQVSGIDLSFNYCRREKAIAEGVQVMQASGDALPLQTGSIDVVLCSEVIEHLPPALAVKSVLELGRVARRTIVTTTPNRSAAVRRLARSVVPNRVDELDRQVGHINLVDPGEFIRLLEVSGWTVARLDTRHILPPVIGEGIRLPTALSGLVDATETTATRWSKRSGNVMLALLEPEVTPGSIIS